jgi:polyhydroxyalkanoate synthesis repressor PhaR
MGQPDSRLQGLAPVVAERRARPRQAGAVHPGDGEPRLIKKYSNRKLYDTSSRRYITLEKIGELVRGGENIQVVDRTTGEDLTGITLSQVVLDNERRKNGAVSEKVLQQLVRGPGEALRGAVRQSLSAGEEFIRGVEEKVVRPQELALEEALERTLRRLNIPSQRQLTRFDRQLRELSNRVEALSHQLALLAPGQKAASPRPRRAKGTEPPD